eukprot:gnl/TRDRNA2_/TRDRNA2_147671_c0_seq8.p1 gnl/TRDRNA2_/TRDRNA2_147671_c0~~gnl/TRDRNA2_/TRDRNA2_147671_c0_seq8.p1  ORF type:complete len:374 (+),score=61.16 gnl/TRDRNA2_/TRDRNA2_147671_c0_seq8:159-1124(+)
MVPSDWTQVKWVLLRGIFGTFTVALTYLSVQAGAPIGDIAALSSISVVFAAFLGRLLLAEALNCVHMFAIACSLVGAVVISKPQFIFPQNDSSSRPWLGYALAITAGFSSACVFVCSRKASETSVWLHIFSVQAVFGLLFLPLPFVSNIVDDGNFALAVERPGQTVGWMALLLADIIFYTAAMGFGSKLCPAAASATISSGTWMVSSYVVQWLLTGVDTIALGGAALMLAGIIFMAGARQRAPTEVMVRAPEGLSSEPFEREGQQEEMEGEDEAWEVESLVSFIASELAEQLPREIPLLRQRKFSESKVPPVLFGVVASPA